MPRDKQQVLIRLDNEKLTKFKQLYPWHGSVQSFFNQCLNEILELAQAHPTPTEITSHVVRNVRRDHDY